MRFETATKEIREYWRDNVKAEVLSLSPGFVLVGDNQEILEEWTSPYGRISIMPGDTQRATIGAFTDNLHRSTGITMVSVFVPFGTGDELALRMTDLIARKFTAVTTGIVTFTNASHVRVGRAGKWWQFNVSCPFSFDTTAP